MQALHDIVQTGKVRYIGMSSCWAYQFQMMQRESTATLWITSYPAADVYGYGTRGAISPDASEMAPPTDMETKEERG